MTSALPRLTAEQDVVVDHGHGHALVLAVAGSGKSTTLLHRVIRLLHRGVDPARLLILMFNKPAQMEFERRLREACGKLHLPVPDVLTFHAFGLRLCERFVAAGLLPPAHVVNSDASLYGIARDMVREYNESGVSDDPIDPYGESVREMVDVFDVLKGELYAVTGEVSGDLNPRFVKLFPVFEQMRRRRGFRTFSDMVSDPVAVMETNPAAVSLIAGRFDHILVDEYQDINEAQCRLLRFAAGSTADVMAVGDDDQTVYRFRGAKPEYMVSLFERVFPGAARYTLSGTFRFGHHLAMCANHVIHCNDTRTAKVSVPATRRTTAVDCRMAVQRGDEVVKGIRDWQAAGRPLHEIAILVREFAHSASTERALLAAGIPYRVVGSAPFFERRIVLTLLAHLQLTCGGFAAVGDLVHRQALVNGLLAAPALYLPGKIRDVMARRLVAGGNVAAVAKEVLAVLREGNAQKYRAFEAAVRVWTALSRRTASDDAATVLWEAVRGHDLIGYFFKTSGNRARGTDQVETIKEVLQLAQDFGGSVAAFLDHISALGEAHTALTDADDPDAVLITSIHRAKGLEWPLVILPELDDARFPGHDQDIILEDERRLFYVGITRAIERLLLIAPPDPEMIKWAEGESRGHPLMGGGRASRFLYEMALLRSNRLAEGLGHGVAPAEVYAPTTFLPPRDAPDPKTADVIELKPALSALEQLAIALS